MKYGTKARIAKLREEWARQAAEKKRKEAEERAVYRKAGITAKKYMGDDQDSWAVFKHGRPVFTGLNRRSIAYYKKLALSTS